MSGRRGSGSFGRQRPHRWVCHRGRSDITLARSHCRDPQRACPRLGSKPVPAPRTRYEVRDMFPSGSHRRDRLKHPLPSASKCVRGGVCAGQAEPRRLDVNTLGLWVCNVSSSAEHAQHAHVTCSHVCTCACTCACACVLPGVRAFHTRSRCMSVG